MKKAAFDVRPELVFGVALAAGDKKITWHAQEYLGTLEKALDQAIEGKKK
jgi:F-type H+-transporting ATPase subunit b